MQSLLLLCCWPVAAQATAADADAADRMLPTVCSRLGMTACHALPDGPVQVGNRAATSMAAAATQVAAAAAAAT